MCIHKTMCLKQYEKHKGKMFSRKHSLAISKIILSECALLKVQKFSPLLFKLEVNKDRNLKTCFNLLLNYIMRWKGRLCLQACLTSLSQKRIKGEGQEEYRCNNARYHQDYYQRTRFCVSALPKFCGKNRVLLKHSYPKLAFSLPSFSFLVIAEPVNW